ncbi:MAG: type II toxin-antitoxin system VapB family antitoxin [Deltaproteobacteria bacterium]|nr:type II toxin-antitoxin system VapB family antitoxin [Deltaproteobacteria bacterium]
MATNLDIDDRLLEKAKRLGGHPSKREAVERALLAYVEGLERLAILELAGTLDMEPHGSHRSGRRERRATRRRA